ncbi:MAG: 2-succinyl-5-enolpyruvyl-6-hydroxy-3-cyclohexene-1-carboxylic-acid synthase [Simkaniaceae bacterium]|nr:2-succinyl-5-enolpyruvyl-6-hydroxy-3-cyclohexene-1-carboxylic-acid synthase [Simkaniaceae bacterium]
MQNRTMDGATAATCIVKELIHQGLRHFCIAPGSRSTPLTVAIARHPLAKTTVHFDERSLGFYALGLAKATRSPVAIVTSSGTAVANLMPAVIEASMNQLPLIILSADRPCEMRSTGSNQTIDQMGLFSKFACWESDVPCFDFSISPEQFRGFAATAVSRSCKGPVQLNCMFRKPFLGKKFEDTTPALIRYHKGKSFLSDEQFQTIADQLGKYEDGIILIGELPHTVDPAIFEALSEALGWPIFTDILSNLRSSSHAVPFIRPEETRSQAILQLGSRLTSTKALEANLYILVSSALEPCDPSGPATDQIEMDPEEFARKIVPFLENREITSWSHDWIEEGLNRREAINSFFQARKKPCELCFFYDLNELINENSALFIGNSMPIREANHLLFPDKMGPVFANRGASGIDGNLSTAIGICRGLEMPLVAIVGDLTFLHDVSALSMLRDDPILIIVINNNGGGIFSFQPIAAEVEIFEEYFATPQEINLKKIAESYGIDYVLGTKEDAQEIPLRLKKKKPTLMEIQCDRDQNVIIHQEIEDAIFHERRQLKQPARALFTRLYGKR